MSQKLPGSEEAHPQASSSRSQRIRRNINASIHWLSAFVVVFALIRNGEETGALGNPDAMREEVMLGIAVGVIFLARFIWVYVFHGGRWVAPSIALRENLAVRIANLGIYIGVAATVISGLMIASLAPAAQIFPTRRGFFSSNPQLNGVIVFHDFASGALIWICIFHAGYSLWRLSQPWLEAQRASARPSRQGSGGSSFGGK